MEPKPSIKTQTFERLADALEAEIRREGLRGLLPSGRIMAEQHRVSLPTVQKAIALLVERGFLIRRGERRRLEVAAAAQATPGWPGRNELLVLSTLPLAAYDAALAMGIQELGVDLKAQGDGFRFVDLSGTTGDARRKAAHAEVLKSRPTHCLLMTPDAAVHAGVSRHPVKVASMFGSSRSRRVVSLGVRYGYLVEVAVRHLVALGHRRFFMPFLNRTAKLATSRAGIAKVARDYGVEIAVKISPEACTMENMAKTLTEGLRGGATAVLFPQWTDFLPAIAYLGQPGRQFPRDLSVVALVGNANARLFSPPIAGCLSAPESIAQQVGIWVRSDRVDDASYQSVYVRTWDPGGSTGPAPMPPAVR
jgi:hypothetical protein